MKSQIQIDEDSEVEIDDAAVETPSAAVDETEDNAVAAALEGCAIATWGEGDHGELGHGDRRAKLQPLCLKPFVTK